MASVYISRLFEMPYTYVMVGLSPIPLPIVFVATSFVLIIQMLMLISTLLLMVFGVVDLKEATLM